MIFRGIKKIVKPFVDVPRWMGLKDITTNAKIFFSEIGTLFTYKKAERSETFEAAIARKGLTEADLQQVSNQYKYTAVVYLILAIGTLGYAIYLLSGQHFVGGIPAVCIALLFLVLAFRSHFWFFQIQRRKLGCSIKEWFNFVIGK